MPRTLALLAALALGLSACGEDDNTAEAPPAVGTTPVETSASGTGGTTSGGTVVVDMQSIQYQPRELEARVGQKIRWVNKDSVDHDVVAREGADFKSETFGKGGTFEFVLSEEGKIEYVCTLHPGMDGEITVTR